MLVLAGLAIADPPVAGPRTDGAGEFFDVLNVITRPEPKKDVWNVAEISAPLSWLTAVGPASLVPDLPQLPGADAFQNLLDRLTGDGPGLRSEPAPLALAGVRRDPGRWRYRQETADTLYRLTTKIETPDPFEVRTLPYGGRDWKAEEKFQVPLPLPPVVAEQMFVFGQFSGAGDSFNNQQTTLNGKTGVGVKWSLLAGSELQFRYGTLFNYADVYRTTRFSERTQPAVEVLAKLPLPLIGPWQLEYTGSALPALTSADHDQLRQELKLALPLKGDSEFEFGARYRWDYVQTTPWADRAQLFLGVKLRH